jgi:hypothetical protein
MEVLMRFFRVLGRATAILAVAILAANSSAIGATFFDSTAENFDGNAHMDISSVDVTDNGSNITFKINVSAASITSPDWGKYVIGIDTSSATGDTGTPVGNPWGRNIAMANKMDAWVGSWVDGGGGFQPWTYSGGSWTQNGSGASVTSGNSTTITTSLASLGLSPGQTFNFDVYTTGGGGGDSANDALANPNQTIADWPGPYTTPASGSGAALSYTTAVPEPVSAAMAGVALIGWIGFVRRRK